LRAPKAGGALGVKSGQEVQMKVLGPSEYSAVQGEEITVLVQSVNFNNNAQLDSKLSPQTTDQFTKTGKLTMGTADTSFVIIYGFPPTVPADGKYTVTVSGLNASDVSDVFKSGSDLTSTLPYIVKFDAGN
jgi:hypothetical protein